MKKSGATTLVMLAIALVVLLTDQYSKYLVVTRIPEGTSRVIAPWLQPIVQFTHITNTGVAFGLFPRLGDIFILVAVVVVIVIVVYSRSLPETTPSSTLWLLRVALGLQLGGAISNNLLDRLRLGYVVDFIDVNFWPLADFPVFNVADSSITIGVVILAVAMILDERRVHSTQQVAESD